MGPAVKLTILGGGGVRMPAFVRAVLASRPGTFARSACSSRTRPGGRRSAGWRREIADRARPPGRGPVSGDAAEAFTGADYVFSAVRVGGDRGRVIDEEVALRRGIVGQETTGPGGGAMALRTIPVVLSYCELLSPVAPDAVLINFTNPAGLITQAISAQGKVRAVGVCDTPGGTVERLAEFLRRRAIPASPAAYARPEPPRLGRARCATAAGSGSASCWTGSRSCSVSTTGSRPSTPSWSAGSARSRPSTSTTSTTPAATSPTSAAPGATRGQDVLRLNEELMAGTGQGVRRRRRAGRLVGLRHAARRAPGHLHADRHPGRQRAGRGAGPPVGPAAQPRSPRPGSAATRDWPCGSSTACPAARRAK